MSGLTSTTGSYWDSVPLELSTPALLFPAISLLLLAYTNRFLALAAVIRKLHADHTEHPEHRYVHEITNLRQRVSLIRDMQTLGVASLLSCTVAMCFLFVGWGSAGTVAFSLSLLLMASSLALSIVEIRMSVGALDVHLADMESGDSKEGTSKDEVDARRTLARSKRKWWSIRYSVGTLFWLSVVVALVMLWFRDRSNWK